VQVPPQGADRERGQSSAARAGCRLRREPPTAIEPDAAQQAEALHLPPLRPHDLRADLQPLGENHCGGDFVLPNLTLCHPELGYRMPLFLMAPGAVVSFPGSTLCHGTTTHHDEEAREPGCAAHVSFAVQTPVKTLKMGRSSEERQQLHDKLLRRGHEDACKLDGAVWLPVWQFSGVHA